MHLYRTLNFLYLALDLAIYFSIDHRIMFLESYIKLYSFLVLR